MKRIFIAGLFVVGISLIVTSVGAWLAPDLLAGLPGGVVALFAAVFVAISGLFGGKLTEWADTLFGKKNDDKPPVITNDIDQQVNVENMSGGVVAGEYHHHDAPQVGPEVHDTIGFIPPAKAETYVHRGEIEEVVVTYIREGGTGAIVGVHAPGGLGKTELAKQTAEKLRADFEILWVDVGEKKPQQVVNELHHAYQAHRFLVVLDDVRQATLESLNDLLPSKPCAALVTSRVQQMGGVKTFALDSMSWEQAEELFRAVLGDEAVAAELQALKTLAERCKFNPLAMEIAARRIRQFGGMKKPVARYFEKAQARFSELKMEGDERWDMEKIFDISYQDLSAEDQEKFLSLSVFHPTGFSLEAISAVWNAEPSVSSQTLSRFINLSLVKFVETLDERVERYRLHDLLDEYATPKLKASGNYNPAKALMAQWLVELFNQHYTGDPSNAPQVFVERDNLLHACEWARGEQETEILALLATKSRNWFYNIFRESWVYWFAWLEACLQLGISDNELQANVRKALGDVQQFRDDRDAALASYNEALKLFQAVGAKLGEANVLSALCRMSLSGGDIQTAEAQLLQIVAIRREIGDLYGEGADYGNFAIKLLENGYKEQAKNYARKAREIFEKIKLPAIVEMMDQIISDE